MIGLGADPAAPCAAHALDAPGNGGNALLLGAELLNTGTCTRKTHRNVAWKMLGSQIKLNEY